MGLRVYVAGPISKGNLVLNIRQAIEVAERLKQRGHHPFVPHLTTFHWYFLYAGQNTLTDHSWRDWNFSWLEVCDVFVRLPGESDGSDSEELEAKRLEIPVFHGLDEFMNSQYWGMEKLVK